MDGRQSAAIPPPIALCAHVPLLTVRALSCGAVRYLRGLALAESDNAVPYLSSSVNGGRDDASWSHATSRQVPLPSLIPLTQCLLGTTRAAGSSFVRDAVTLQPTEERAAVVVFPAASREPSARSDDGRGGGVVGALPYLLLGPATVGQVLAGGGRVPIEAIPLSAAVGVETITAAAAGGGGSHTSAPWTVLRLDDTVGRSVWWQEDHRAGASGGDEGSAADDAAHRRNTIEASLAAAAAAMSSDAGSGVSSGVLRLHPSEFGNAFPAIVACRQFGAASGPAAASTGGVEALCGAAAAKYYPEDGGAECSSFVRIATSSLLPPPSSPTTTSANVGVGANHNSNACRRSLLLAALDDLAMFYRRTIEQLEAEARLGLAFGLWRQWRAPGADSAYLHAAIESVMIDAAASAGEERDGDDGRSVLVPSLIPLPATRGGAAPLHPTAQLYEGTADDLPSPITTLFRQRRNGDAHSCVEEGDGPPSSVCADTAPSLSPVRVPALSLLEEPSSPLRGGLAAVGAAGGPPPPHEAQSKALLGDAQQAPRRRGVSFHASVVGSGSSWYNDDGLAAAAAEREAPHGAVGVEEGIVEIKGIRDRSGDLSDDSDWLDVRPSLLAVRRREGAAAASVVVSSAAGDVASDFYMPLADPTAEAFHRQQQQHANHSDDYDSPQSSAPAYHCDTRRGSAAPSTTTLNSPSALLATGDSRLSLHHVGGSTTRMGHGIMADDGDNRNNDGVDDALLLQQGGNSVMHMEDTEVEGREIAAHVLVRLHTQLPLPLPPPATSYPLSNSGSSAPHNNTTSLSVMDRALHSAKSAYLRATTRLEGEMDVLLQPMFTPYSKDNGAFAEEWGLRASPALAREDAPPPPSPPTCSSPSRGGGCGVVLLPNAGTLTLYLPKTRLQRLMGETSRMLQVTNGGFVRVSDEGATPDLASRTDRHALIGDYINIVRQFDLRALVDMARVSVPIDAPALFADTMVLDREAAREAHLASRRASSSSAPSPRATAPSAGSVSARRRTSRVDSFASPYVWSEGPHSAKGGVFGAHDRRHERQRMHKYRCYGDIGLRLVFAAATGGDGGGGDGAVHGRDASLMESSALDDDQRFYRRPQTVVQLTFVTAKECSLFMDRIGVLSSRFMVATLRDAAHVLKPYWYDPSQDVDSCEDGGGNGGVEGAMADPTAVVMGSSHSSPISSADPAASGGGDALTTSLSGRPFPVATVGRPHSRSFSTVGLGGSGSHAPQLMIGTGATAANDGNSTPTSPVTKGLDSITSTASKAFGSIVGTLHKIKKEAIRRGGGAIGEDYDDADDAAPSGLGSGEGVGEEVNDSPAHHDALPVTLSPSHHPPSQLERDRAYSLQLAARAPPRHVLHRYTQRFLSGKHSRSACSSGSDAQSSSQHLAGVAKRLLGATYTSREDELAARRRALMDLPVYTEGWMALALGRGGSAVDDNGGASDGGAPPAVDAAGSSALVPQAPPTGGIVQMCRKATVRSGGPTSATAASAGDINAVDEEADYVAFGEWSVRCVTCDALPHLTPDVSGDGLVTSTVGRFLVLKPSQRISLKGLLRRGGKMITHSLLLPVQSFAVSVDGAADNDGLCGLGGEGSDDWGTMFDIVYDERRVAQFLKPIGGYVPFPMTEAEWAASQAKKSLPANTAAAAAVPSPLPPSVHASSPLVAPKLMARYREKARIIMASIVASEEAEAAARSAKVALSEVMGRGGDDAVPAQSQSQTAAVPPRPSPPPSSLRTLQVKCQTHADRAAWLQWLSTVQGPLGHAYKCRLQDKEVEEKRGLLEAFLDGLDAEEEAEGAQHQQQQTGPALPLNLPTPAPSSTSSPSPHRSGRIVLPVSSQEEAAALLAAAPPWMVEEARRVVAHEMRVVYDGLALVEGCRRLGGGAAGDGMITTPTCTTPNMISDGGRGFPPFDGAKRRRRRVLQSPSLDSGFAAFYDSEEEADGSSRADGATESSFASSRSSSSSESDEAAAIGLGHRGSRSTAAAVPQRRSTLLMASSASPFAQKAPIFAHLPIPHNTNGDGKKHHRARAARSGSGINSVGRRRRHVMPLSKAYYRAAGTPQCPSFGRIVVVEGLHQPMIASRSASRARSCDDGAARPITVGGEAAGPLLPTACSYSLPHVTFSGKANAIATRSVYGVADTRVAAGEVDEGEKGAEATRQKAHHTANDASNGDPSSPSSALAHSHAQFAVVCTVVACGVLGVRDGLDTLIDASMWSARVVVGVNGGGGGGGGASAGGRIALRLGAEGMLPFGGRREIGVTFLHGGEAERFLSVVPPMLDPTMAAAATIHSTAAVPYGIPMAMAATDEGVRDERAHDVVHRRHHRPHSPRRYGEASHQGVAAEGEEEVDLHVSLSPPLRRIEPCEVEQRIAPPQPPLRTPCLSSIPLPPMLQTARAPGLLHGYGGDDGLAVGLPEGGFPLHHHHHHHLSPRVTMGSRSLSPAFIIVPPHDGRSNSRTQQRGGGVHPPPMADFTTSPSPSGQHLPPSLAKADEVEACDADPDGALEAQTLLARFLMQQRDLILSREAAAGAVAEVGEKATEAPAPPAAGRIVFISPDDI